MNKYLPEETIDWIVQAQVLLQEMERRIVACDYNFPFENLSSLKFRVDMIKSKAKDLRKWREK